jgi:nucleotide-binding universal stress UspA family protein
MNALQSILVPTDGSSPSLAALEHAVALAIDSDATIDVLYVAVPEDLAISSAPDVRVELERELSEAIARAHAQLGGRLKRIDVEGDPLREILETAGEGHYDLIVMGTHGRTGRLQALLGSVAAGVVRNAPCPVLSVREASPGYQSFAERRHGRPTIAEQIAHH